MVKAQQKQTMGDDFWADFQRGLVLACICAGIAAITFLISFSIALYIVG